ncbi:Spt2p Ecym_7222 [Eremothecium cymbalariae DBVPG|uniref:SPT2 chromatin protein n=1 Tax=Eremothecium cymbalariae (strain CBS 270.75 / DBVPG 7215 / KCTC 17166 / NRRL Y-17582) TaxID=931890 RepID=G8JW53_ERECY|nr:hypothetical protein Ecym_7222 [Eremothecium cymbalariae DBVPG\
MSFLAKLSKLKKTASATTKSEQSTNSKDKSNLLLNDDSTLLPKHYIREEDPAIRRLKEKRRQDQIKRGSLGTPRSGSRKRLKTPGASRSNKGELSEEDDKVSFTTKWKLPNPSKVSKPSVPKGPLKKLSFDDLMKQAEEKAKSSKPEPDVATQSSRTTTTKLTKRGFKDKTRHTPKALVKGFTGGSPVKKKPIEKPVKIRVPSSNGIAKPNEKLRKMLEKRNIKRQTTEFEGNGSDLEDFIDDEEDEVDSQDGYGYNKDEIWSIFNKGRKRRYSDDYNDYDDDMEANEMEILEEEDYSSKVAKREDKMEEEWMRKHEEEKKKKWTRA